LEVDAQQNAKTSKKEGKSALELSSLSCSVSAKARKPTKPTNKKRARETNTQRDTDTHRDGEQGRADSGRGSSAVHLH